MIRFFSFELKVQERKGSARNGTCHVWLKAVVRHSIALGSYGFVWISAHQPPLAPPVGEVLSCCSLAVGKLLAPSPPAASDNRMNSNCDSAGGCAEERLSCCVVGFSSLSLGATSHS